MLTALLLWRVATALRRRRGPRAFFLNAAPALATAAVAILDRFAILDRLYDTRPLLQFSTAVAFFAAVVAITRPRARVLALGINSRLSHSLQGRHVTATRISVRVLNRSPMHLPLRSSIGDRNASSSPLRHWDSECIIISLGIRNGSSSALGFAMPVCGKDPSSLYIRQQCMQQNRPGMLY